MARRSGWGRLGMVPPVLVAVTIATGTFGALAGSVALHPRRAPVLAGDGGPAWSPSAGTQTFSITGRVSRLYPGATRPLTLTVRDLEPYPIVVTTITTSVGVARPGCAATWLSVVAFRGTLVVPAGQERTLRITARLGADAPDACQGAVFPLHYTGTGRRK